MDAGHLLVGDALGAQPLGAVGVRALRAHRADVAGVRLQRGLERRDVELVVVGEDADGGSLVHVRAREELVGPLDDQLVHVGEALARDELGARVADGHPVAEEAAHLGDRGGVVDGAEDVHVRPGREGRDEELPLGRVDDPRLPAGEELRRGAAVVGADEPLRADVLAGDPDLERDRPFLPHRLHDRDDDLWVEPVDEDVDGAAAGEADLERLLVGDPVGLQPGLAAREHLARLAVDGGLDAAAGHRADHVAPVRDRQRGAGIARGRALRVDHGRDRDRRAVRGPALERREDVPHGALRL